MVTLTYGASDNSPVAVEAGTYPATIKRATEGQSKSGNPMITVIWRLDNGLELFDHIVDHPAPLCRKKSDEFLVALGNEAKKGAKVDVDATALVGVVAKVVLILRDGKNEVAGYEVASKEQQEQKDDNVPF